MKLEIELVPATSWFTNVRSAVSQKVWDLIRMDCYKKANHKCEVCGGIGNKWKVECHEIWEYDDKNQIQKLMGLIALCPNCHKVKHSGLSIKNGMRELVISQLMKVNKIDRQAAIKHINDAFKIWDSRSNYDWDIWLAQEVNKFNLNQ